MFYNFFKYLLLNASLHDHSWTFRLSSDIKYSSFIFWPFICHLESPHLNPQGNLFYFWLWTHLLITDLETNLASFMIMRFNCNKFMAMKSCLLLLLTLFVVEIKFKSRQAVKYNILSNCTIEVKTPSLPNGFLTSSVQGLLQKKQFILVF